MRSRHHTEDNLAAARASIVELLRKETGGDEARALKMAAAVLGVIHQQFAGEQVYFRKPAPYDERAVLQDIAAGHPPAEIRKRHRISKTTYYELRAHWRTQRVSATGTTAQVQVRDRG